MTASIIIPTFNREYYIRQCIESASNQTYTDIEIIVTDNCSTDKTVDIVKELQQKDARIILLENSKNYGPVVNWMKGVEAAKGEYCKLLFSDDLIDRYFIERLINPLLSADTAFSISSVIIGEKEWEGGQYYKIFENDCLINAQEYINFSLVNFNSFPLSPGAGLFRKKDLKKNLLIDFSNVLNFEFNTTGAGVDWLIYLLTAESYNYVAYFANAYSYFRAHHDSISIRNENGSVMEAYSKIREWYLQRIR